MWRKVGNCTLTNDGDKIETKNPKTHKIDKWRGGGARNKVNGRQTTHISYLEMCRTVNYTICSSEEDLAEYCPLGKVSVAT